MSARPRAGNAVDVPDIDAVRERVLKAAPTRVIQTYFYWRRFGRLATFKAPETFTEKVNWRLLNDRRPILAFTCDKAATKEHVLSSGVDIQVPEQLWFGTDLAEFAALELEGDWVLKPNHRAGGVVIFGSGRPDLQALQTQTAGWMKSYEAEVLSQWAYTQARPGFIAERRIGESDVAPVDYKFFVFDGVPRLVQVDTDRFQGHQRRFYDPGWAAQPHRSMHPLGPVIDRPEHFEEMLRLAGALGEPFDFVRVDLYDTAGGVFFGELTPYPGAGLEPYEPDDLDRRLGSYWRLPSLR